jgi:glutathione S-transferase
MLVVHHLNDSRSQRILWALEELAVPYEIVRYDRDKKTMLAPASLQKVHPLGKSPVVVDEGHTIAESGAILEYLIDRYGGKNGAPELAPAADAFDERMKYRFWLHYAEGSLMPMLLLRLITNQIQTAKVPFFIKPVTKQIAGKLEAGFVAPNLARHLDFIEKELAGKTWLVGEALSGADIQMSFPLEAGRARGGITAATHPNIWALVERIHARPAFERALERGGPYSYA